MLEPNDTDTAGGRPMSFVCVLSLLLLGRVVIISKPWAWCTLQLSQKFWAHSYLYMDALWTGQWIPPSLNYWYFSSGSSVMA